MADGLLLILFLVSYLFVSGVSSRNFTIENNCNHTVWPAIRSTGSSPLSTTGFSLKRGEARVIEAPSGWTGRFWGRTFCSENSTGGLSCATGDCDSRKVKCSGFGKPPVTLAEFSLDVRGGPDYYDVSLVDGYNLPIVIAPQGDKTCSTVGCVNDLKTMCPNELRVKGNTSKMQPIIACMSACQTFRLPKYCCGTYSATEKCPPTTYSPVFKRACPRAYSYAYDDYSSSLFTCRNQPSYVITFCPSTTFSTTNISVAQSPLPVAQPPYIFPVAPSPFPVVHPPFPAQKNNGTLEPPSESQPTKEATTEQKKKSSWKLKLILGISASLFVMIILMVAVIVRAKKARKSDWNGKNDETVVMLKQYSYKKVKKMTNSFAHVLGKGGFGTVYKGKLPEEGRDIAVKILKESEGNGEEFVNEVASMSRTSHVNIVSLLGFCYEGKKRAIIYEFMPNGSLDKFISENMSAKMEWETLYDIALGISRGLEYLHNRCVSRIVHFDIKPQNILMDKNLCPKISDFGLARLCKNNESIMSMLDARGTAGYTAPEVFSTNFGGVSHKSDVYSYGMVVLEMIGARNREKFENSGSNNSSMYFPDWIYKDFERGEIMRIFGDEIAEEEEKNIAKKMVLVGLWCIQTNPSHRPTMVKVIEMLEGSVEAIQVPPKPIWCLPTSTVPETVEESDETSSFSIPSQFESGTLSCEDTFRFSKEAVHQTLEDSQQHSSTSS
ncbi:unnamed protein product [Microthlaspi erraticum]|uniref:Protein kinase domain-containing protein n=1 Tax=Microthlaspi erraticum TaxID=1685480 RepID=A0A6D2HT83_9BRAS|nr:unnamed protein product [Microthlaspi erraticum]